MPFGAAVGGAGLFGMSAGTTAAVGALAGGALAAGGSYLAGERQAAGQRRAAEQFRPYADAGRGALTTLASLYGTDGSGQQAFNPAALEAFRSTPGYQFARSEGLGAIDHGSSARGQLLSSNNRDQRQSFGTGLADRTFQGSYVDPLMRIAGMGMQGASGAAGALSGAANASAGGIAGAFNNVGFGLANAGNLYMQGQNNDRMFDMLSRMNGSAYSPQQFNQMWQNATPNQWGALGSGGAP